MVAAPWAGLASQPRWRRSADQTRSVTVLPAPTLPTGMALSLVWTRTCVEVAYAMVGKAATTGAVCGEGFASGRVSSSAPTMMAAVVAAAVAALAIGRRRGPTADGGPEGPVGGLAGGDDMIETAADHAWLMVWRTTVRTGRRSRMMTMAGAHSAFSATRSLSHALQRWQSADFSHVSMASTSRTLQVGHTVQVPQSAHLRACLST